MTKKYIVPMIKVLSTADNKEELMSLSGDVGTSNQFSNQDFFTEDESEKESVWDINK